MKFNPSIFFLITSGFCLFYVIYHLYSGDDLDFTFWNATMWIFLGVFFYKVMGKGAKKEQKQMDANKLESKKID